MKKPGANLIGLGALVMFLGIVALVAPVAGMDLAIVRDLSGEKARMVAGLLVGVGSALVCIGAVVMRQHGSHD